VVPYTKSRILLGTDLDFEQRSVRGTLVQGLTEADIEYLDVFEGDEYTRETVRVHPLEAIVPLNATISDDIQPQSSGASPTSIAPKDPAPLPERAALTPSIECQTYIWCHPISELEKELWSFAEFVKMNSYKWIGRKSNDNEDYKAVERRLMENNMSESNI